MGSFSTSSISSISMGFRTRYDCIIVVVFFDILVSPGRVVGCEVAVDTTYIRLCDHKSSVAVRLYRATMMVREAADVLRFPGRECRSMRAKGLWIVRSWFEVGVPLLRKVCERDLLNAISYAGCSATPLMPGWRMGW